MGENKKGLKKVPSNDRSEDYYTYEYITEVKRWFVKSWREKKNGAKNQAKRQRPQVRCFACKYDKCISKLIIRYKS